MTDPVLQALLGGNDRHAASLPSDYFDDVQSGQEPAVVSMCCSDSRVAQEGMWDVNEPGWLFTPSTIGNQVWDDHDGDRVVDGNVLYPIRHAGTEVAVVVGHTGCGAVTAALEAVQGDGHDEPAGIAKWVEMLVPVVEAGLADDRVDPDRDVSLVDQLVEYNVDRQVTFLRDREEIPPSLRTYGFVYDFQGVYGDVLGRTYLVNLDGETDAATIQNSVPAEYDDHVRRLL